MFKPTLTKSTNYDLIRTYRKKFFAEDNKMRGRVERFDSQSIVAALAIGVLCIPRVYERVDAFLTFPGQGEKRRLIEPIRQWNNKEVSARFFLIAGHNTRERTSDVFDFGRLQQEPYNLRRLDGVHYAVHAEHTREQADWTCGKIDELGIRSIALFVSPYHLLRAYLTLLKAMMKRGQDAEVALVPVPTPVSLDSISPENSVDMWQLIPGEISRIRRYQQKGDAATLPELQQYLGWLWRQHSLFSAYAA